VFPKKRCLFEILHGIPLSYIEIIFGKGRNLPKKVFFGVYPEAGKNQDLSPRESHKKRDRTSHAASSITIPFRNGLRACT
jgi:hypothetical protein